MSVEWADPPKNSAGRPGGQWAPAADELKANPGRWARVAKGAKSRALSGAINSGRVRGFEPKGTFEARSRKGDVAGTFDIYARFVGEEA